MKGIVTPELVIGLLKAKGFAELRKFLSELMPADIAALFGELSDEREDFGEKELTLTFRILPKDLAADVFAYMDADLQIMLINGFSDRELSAVLDELYLDDTVDMIEDMPANVVTRILKVADKEKRKQINELLKYPDDSAGSIMTTEFVYFYGTDTVKEALTRIKAVGIVKETVYTCYVTEQKKLIGSVSLLDLVVADANELIKNVMDTTVISVRSHEDQEKVANLFSKHDLAAVPVVDDEDRILGIITFDDVMDVMREENAEDMAMMSAVVPVEGNYFDTSIFKHAAKRMPWLLILMLSATITGAITNHFEALIASIPLLVAFMPMLTDTGGNCGSQTSSLIIQGMAVEEIQPKDFFRVVFKEFRVAIICAAVLAAVNFGRIMLFYKNPLLAAVVSVALVCTVILSKLLGCVLPMLAKRLVIDPAIMSAPLLSTLVDSCSTLIFFSFASKLMAF